MTLRAHDHASESSDQQNVGVQATETSGWLTGTTPALLTHSSVEVRALQNMLQPRFLTKEDKISFSNEEGFSLLSSCLLTYFCRKQHEKKDRKPFCVGLRQIFISPLKRFIIGKLPNLSTALFLVCKMGITVSLL